MWETFEEMSGETLQVSMRDFEDMVEEKALNLIETAVGIIERNKK